MSHRVVHRLLPVTGTIRFRVTAMATLAVLLVLSAAGTGLVLVQRAQLMESLDETLAQQAHSVVDAWHAGEPVVAEEAIFDDVGVQVIGSGGDILAVSPTLAGVPSLGQATAGGPSTVTVTFPETGDQRVRVVSRSVDGVTIHVAASLDDVQESIAVLIGSLLLAVPMTASALAGVLWWSVGRALRPVDDIRTQVDQVSATRLDRRVPEPPTRDEVARLAHTMNSMLERLDASTERQRRFVADASHELRSPLTRIRSELEVDAVHPGSADLAATHRSVLAETIALQGLVDDLLLLARGDVVTLNGSRHEPVDLDEVVREEVRRARVGTTRDIDTTGVRPVQAAGVPTQLSRAVANLLENATRHARTRVTVTLTETDDQRAMLTVLDDGPGIASEQSEVVFERFTRLDDARHPDSGGAGLGLAIARDIAIRHQGTLTLQPTHGPGAQFVLILPIRSG